MAKPIFGKISSRRNKCAHSEMIIRIICIRSLTRQARRSNIDEVFKPFIKICSLEHILLAFFSLLRPMTTFKVLVDQGVCRR